LLEDSREALDRIEKNQRLELARKAAKREPMEEQIRALLRGDVAVASHVRSRSICAHPGKPFAGNRALLH